MFEKSLVGLFVKLTEGEAREVWLVGLLIHHFHFMYKNVAVSRFTVASRNSPGTFYDTELHCNGICICRRTRSSHWSGPFKCSSIQHGVDVTVCRLKENIR